MQKHLAGFAEDYRSGMDNAFAEPINGRIQATMTRAKAYSTDSHLVTIGHFVRAKIKHR